MILTLYKNCILNDNYNEVFDLTLRKVDGVESSVFTDYLKSLSNTVINLPNVYYSRNMSFTLRISGDNKAKEAFEYNYCKIEAEGIIRYCFITDIELANSVATYYTEEDIWSNYAYDMQFRYGYLTQSKKLQYNDLDISFYHLPQDYQSNNKIQLYEAHKLATSEDIKFNIICQLQCYTIATKEQPTRRASKYVLITNNAANQAFTYLEATSLLLNMEYASSFATLTLGDNLKWIGIDTANFEIDNVYIIPARWDIGAWIRSASEKDKTAGLVASKSFEMQSKESLISGITTFAANFYNLSYFLIDDGFHHYPRLLEDGIVKNNFKTKSIGTYTSQYDLSMNGTDISYSVTCFSSDTSFTLFLNVQEKIIDITNDFYYDIPIDALTADVMAQRKIAHNLAIYNNVKGIISGTAETALNAGAIASGNISSISSSYIKRNYAKRERADKLLGKKYLTSRTTSSATTKSALGTGSVSGILGGVGDIADGIAGLIAEFTPAYTSVSGVFATSIAILNASLGIVYSEITPDNEKIVNDFISLVGYNVYEVIKQNLIFKQNFTDYNILRFNEIDIYGSFPQSIKLALESILTSGFKIWYNSELKEKIENADI